MSSKKIRFDFFTPVLQDNTPVDLKSYIKYYSNIDPEERVFDYAGTSIRIDVIKEHYNYVPADCAELKFPIWEIRFTRVRPDSPGVYRKGRIDLKPLNLDPDEYIADDTSALYDNDKNIFILQRNRIGAGPSVVQKIFNKIIVEKNDYICLRPLINDNTIQKIKSFAIDRGLTARIDVKKAHDSGNQTVQQIIEVASELSSTNIPIQLEINLKVDTLKRNVSLPIDYVNKLILSLKNEDFVDKLIVAGKVDEESPLEEVDLIEQHIMTWGRFKIDETKFIHSREIFDYIAHSYNMMRHGF